jgi:ApaG protein
MESATRYAIDVQVRTHFLEDQSAPENARFAFAYTIQIRNQGLVSARLLRRHWIITDANGKVQEVRGDGVIGEQPLLQPGQSYTYSSGAILETSVGTMRGSYTMLAEDGLHFEAPISSFTLAIPRTLH